MSFLTLLYCTSCNAKFSDLLEGSLTGKRLLDVSFHLLGNIISFYNFFCFCCCLLLCSIIAGSSKSSCQIILPASADFVIVERPLHAPFGQIIIMDKTLWYILYVECWKEDIDTSFFFKSIFLAKKVIQTSRTVYHFISQ